MGINQLKKKIAIDLARRTRERVIHRFIYKLHLCFFLPNAFLLCKAYQHAEQTKIELFFPLTPKNFPGVRARTAGGTGEWRMLQEIFKKASRKLQESYKKASRKLQESFKKASRKLQVSFLEAFLMLS